MPHCALPDRQLISVVGPDAEHLLHNVLTADIEGLRPGIARACALLTPQGKVLFDFLIARDGDGFLIDISVRGADAFLKRMMLYKLRSNVDFSKRDEPIAAASWDGDCGLSQIDSAITLEDPRFASSDVKRHILPTGAGPAGAASRADWDTLRIIHGVAESDIDFASGDVFGHDISYDHNGGLDFKKGCFVGQEVVSRMQHRGTARRRIVVVEGETALPAPGTEIIAGGKSAGALGTVVDNRGLAIVRLDRIKSAMDANAPIAAGDVAVAIRLPDGAGYRWPEPAADDA